MGDILSLIKTINYNKFLYTYSGSEIITYIAENYYISYLNDKCELKTKYVKLNIIEKFYNILFKIKQKFYHTNTFDVSDNFISDCMFISFNYFSKEFKTKINKKDLIDKINSINEDIIIFNSKNNFATKYLLLSEQSNNFVFSDKINADLIIIKHNFGHILNHFGYSFFPNRKGLFLKATKDNFMAYYIEK